MVKWIVAALIIAVLAFIGLTVIPGLFYMM